MSLGQIVDVSGGVQDLQLNDGLAEFLTQG